MTSKKMISYLIVLMPFICCAQKNSANEINERIQTLDRQKFEDPRKTLNELQSIIKISGLPDSLIGTACMEISVCYGMMNEIDSGIIYANKALPLISDPNNKIATYKTLGLLYNFSRQNELAQKAFEQALKECDKIPENLDMKALVLGEFANFYYENNDYINNIKLLNKAIDIRNKIKNDKPQFMATLRQKMSATFIAMGNFEFAEKENMEIIRLLQNSNSEHRFSFLGYAYQNIGLCKQNAKNYAASDSNFLRSIKIFRKIENKDMVGYSLAEIAKNKLLTNQPSEALTIIDTAYLLMKEARSTYLLEAATVYLNTLEKLNRFEDGKKIYKDSLVIANLKDNYSVTALTFYKVKIPFLSFLHNYQEELTNLNTIIAISDSVFNQQKLAQIVELQAKYQIQLKEKDEKLLKQENQLLTQKIKLNTGLLMLSLIIGTVIILFFLYRNVKNKLRLETQSNEIKQKEKENQMLSQRAQAEAKDKELKEIIIEQQKQEMLLHAEKIQQLENDLLSSTNKNLESEREEIRKHLHKLKEGKEYLELFMAKFNTLYPNFSQQLINKYPALNNSDIVFCALVRINLSTKEIGAVLNIEQFSVYRRKYRIMEKMDMKSDDDFKNIVFGV
jgi:tetratricopeptide (TPR) repeat protein